ncbi:MAG: metallophosphoesterase family protein [Candidatus Dormibacteria bacterium]
MPRGPALRHSLPPTRTGTTAPCSWKWSGRLGSSSDSRSACARLVQRILHVADLHLDRAFRGLGFTGVDAGQRRRLLRRGLEWTIEKAQTLKPDLVTVGGDLFELEHVTRDTVAFIVRQFAKAGCPVLCISGNHDAATPASPWRTALWPSNVRLMIEPRLESFQLEDLTVWGFGYTGPDMEPGILDGFSTPADRGVHILLGHGMDNAAAPPGWGGAAFTPATTRSMGFTHALLGHIHQGRVGEWISYPGSLVPIDADEDAGLHGALWVEIDGGKAMVEAIDPGLLRNSTVTLDLSSIQDTTELEHAVRAAAEGGRGGEVSLVTVRLVGRRSASLRPEIASLAGLVCGDGLGVRVVDLSAPEADLEELAREPNARGHAIAELLASGAAESREAAALLAEAFYGDLRPPA